MEKWSAKMECMLRSVRSQLPFSYLLFLFFLRGNKNWNKFKHNFKYDDNLIAPQKDILFFLLFPFNSITFLLNLHHYLWGENTQEE